MKNLFLLITFFFALSLNGQDIQFDKNDEYYFQVAEKRFKLIKKIDMKDTTYTLSRFINWEFQGWLSSKYLGHLLSCATTLNVANVLNETYLKDDFRYYSEISHDKYTIFHNYYFLKILKYGDDFPLLYLKRDGAFYVDIDTENRFIVKYGNGTCSIVGLDYAEHFILSLAHSKYDSTTQTVQNINYITN